MPVMQTINEGLVPVKVFTDTVEDGARKQLVDISKLDIIHNHVAAMPDVHMGIGATIGSVIPTKNAIIPAAVGVDIGCGMMARPLSIKADQLPDSLKSLRSKIESKVPVGFSVLRDPIADDSILKSLKKRLDVTLDKHPKLSTMSRNINDTYSLQLGTLGGGNHFIELCVDQNDDVWIMLHSGSRGTGNILGRYFIKLAKNDMPDMSISTLPNKDLAYFTKGAEHFDDYWTAVKWAQDYALWNRITMMESVIDACKETDGFPEFSYATKDDVVECHHNYVSVERHFNQTVFVTRKGAILAGKGDRGIIPGSMGTKSYIVRGKGNVDSFQSCAHGAGRRMSRTAAKKTYNVADLVKQTDGVECRKDDGILDEIPGAYKDIDTVMQNQKDLVDIEHTLRAVLCVKG